MKVLCIDNGGLKKELTVGNLYEVTGMDHYSFTIIDNDGIEWFYKKSRFIVCD